MPIYHPQTTCSCTFLVAFLFLSNAQALDLFPKEFSLSTVQTLHVQSDGALVLQLESDSWKWNGILLPSRLFSGKSGIQVDVSLYHTWNATPGRWATAVVKEGRLCEFQWDVGQQIWALDGWERDAPLVWSTVKDRRGEEEEGNCTSLPISPFRSLEGNVRRYTCPPVMQILTIGVAIDQSYISRLGSVNNALNKVASVMHSASAALQAGAGVQLQIGSIVYVGTGGLSSSTWNACYSITDKLYRFSMWRGTVQDDAGLWHLMTGCYSSGHVGVSWTGTVCLQCAQLYGSDMDGTTPSCTVPCTSGSECESGTGISSDMNDVTSDWLVVAHELGHSLGASHVTSGGTIMMSNIYSVYHNYYAASTKTSMCNLIGFTVETGGFFGNCFVGPMPLGSNCSANDECGSDHCVGGHCCVSGCTGACEDPCIDDIGLCQQKANGSVCDIAQCTVSTLEFDWKCETGVCVPHSSQSCSPYLCDNNTCVSSCVEPYDCAPGFVCEHMQCIPPFPIASACNASWQCVSNICENGRCCATACSPVCEECGVLGHCVVVNAPLVCQSSVCDADRIHVIDNWRCSGAQCLSNVSFSCAPYLCSGGTCLSSCWKSGEMGQDAGCIPGWLCDYGVCMLPRSVGEPCKESWECDSERCVYEVCCESSCPLCFTCGMNGSCTFQSNTTRCDVCHHCDGIGHCIPSLAGSSSNGECIEENESTCGTNGLCDGQGGCALHKDTVCRVATEPCQLNALCTGKNRTCPAHLLALNTVICTTALPGDRCQLPIYCDGVHTSCLSREQANCTQDDICSGRSVCCQSDRCQCILGWEASFVCDVGPVELVMDMEWVHSVPWPFAFHYWIQVEHPVLVRLTENALGYLHLFARQGEPAYKLNADMVAMGLVKVHELTITQPGLWYLAVETNYLIHSADDMRCGYTLLATLVGSTEPQQDDVVEGVAPSKKKASAGVIAFAIGMGIVGALVLVVLGLGLIALVKYAIKKRQGWNVVVEEEEEEVVTTELVNKE